jgi:hypothetical protein
MIILFAQQPPMITSGLRQMRHALLSKASSRRVVVALA